MTLKRKVSAADEQLTRPVEKCLACSAVLTCPGGWCERCAPDKQVCKSRAQGCTFTGYTHKCWKHQDYFCQQGTKCYLCNTGVSQGTLAAHYGSAHQDVTYRAGSTWRAKQNTTTQWPHCLLTSAAGIAVCKYKLTDSQFDLRVYTRVPSEQLHKVRCSVQVTDPATGHTHTFTPVPLYVQWYDWRIELNRNNFPSWNIVFDVCVGISKID